MKWKFVIVLLCAWAFSLQAQTNQIKVYFLYGSRPAKCCKSTEKRLFGGINGGHVSIGVDDEIIGFGPVGKFHFISRKKQCHSGFRCEPQESFNLDSVGKKYVVITIPVSDEQYAKIKDIHNRYQAETPYDYAFMGMRCAAASYDVLSQIGLLEMKPRTTIALQIFYPRRLRRRMLKIAEERGYKIERKEGSQSRVWERE